MITARIGSAFLLLLLGAPLRANLSVRDNLLSSLWPPGNANALWFSDLALAVNPDPTRPALSLITEGDAPAPPLVTQSPADPNEYWGDPAAILASVSGVSQIGYAPEPSGAGTFFAELNADPPFITMGIVIVTALLGMLFSFRRRRAG